MQAGVKMGGLFFSDNLVNRFDNGLKANDKLFGVFHREAFFYFVVIFSERMVVERVRLRFIGRRGRRVGMDADGFRRVPGFFFAQARNAVQNGPGDFIDNRFQSMACALAVISIF